MSKNGYLTLTVDLEMTLNLIHYCNKPKNFYISIICSVWSNLDNAYGNICAKKNVFGLIYVQKWIFDLDL